MKKIKTIQYIFVIMFFLIIFFFMITTLFNDEKVSETERRTLETFPKFSLKKLIDSNYYNDLTKAFNDQLEFRSYLVKGYFLFQFQRYYGDVVKGKNNQLYTASQKEVNASYYTSLKKVTDLINEESLSLKKSNTKFIFLSIPRKDAYMTKELPKTYNSSLNIYQKQVQVVKDNLDKDIIFIDALEVFKNGNIYSCYYSNDHHITPRCAYLLYKEINKYTKTLSYDLEDMFKVNKTIVNGAYSRQLGNTVKSTAEELYLTPKKKIFYTRYEDNEESKKEVYGEGNTYEDAYMEGDNAFTRIETNKVGKNIMFVGSSFTNILEALTIPSYNRIISIDYRHNKTGNSIYYYTKKYDIDYVIFIPSQSNNAFSIPMIKLHLGK